MSSSSSSSVAAAEASEKTPVQLCKGIDGLDKVVLNYVRGSSVEIYLYGAQVTSWKNERGEELLFVSSKAIFKSPKPIRGGIPLCFPQFSNHGPLEAHGFARTRFWIIDPSPPPQPSNSSNKKYVDLLLTSTEVERSTWPHSFEFRLRVALGPAGDLTLTSRIRNIDSKPFSFKFAYHNYFSISDIREVRVEGLETLDYLDNLKDRERFTEQRDSLTFETEEDKIYLSTPSKIAIMDHAKKRTVVIHKDGLPDAVVWNPWDKKAKAMPDFGKNEYKCMLCIGAAAIENSITLKPGEEWTGRQELSPVLSSYCSGQLDPQRVLGDI